MSRAIWIYQIDPSVINQVLVARLRDGVVRSSFLEFLHSRQLEFVAGSQMQGAKILNRIESEPDLLAPQEIFEILLWLDSKPFDLQRPSTKATDYPGFIRLYQSANKLEAQLMSNLFHEFLDHEINGLEGLIRDDFGVSMPKSIFNDFINQILILLFGIHKDSRYKSFLNEENKGIDYQYFMKDVSRLAKTIDSVFANFVLNQLNNLINQDIDKTNLPEMDLVFRNAEYVERFNQIKKSLVGLGARIIYLDSN